MTSKQSEFKIQFFGVRVRFPPRVQINRQIILKPCKYRYLQGFYFYSTTYNTLQKGHHSAAAIPE